MKNFFISMASCFLLIALITSFSWAQESPHTNTENTVDGVKIIIEYHSPKVKGRIIWGGLEPYDKVWRTGADNATTIEVSENVKIGKNKMPKGKYALFTIPKKGDTWTVIINKVADQWGAFSYDEKQDLFRFDVKVERTLEINESLKFEVKDDGTVIFGWEYKSFNFKIEK
ncbi:MAG: DUF2911 domain-containing protein [Cyclobacteriaceae bacterium]|nr:DUF2911 domain-containing protein [Cyclobacteriaceae bacterium]